VVFADKVRSFVGLAVRSRSLAVGREACKRAARQGSLHLLLLADDAGQSAARDCGAGPQTRTVQSGFDKRGLGALLGRESVAAIGITDADLAAGLWRHAAAAPPPQT
jgi:ribosomal protein L7Ae-like RNA K-turn-binding protein